MIEVLLALAGFHPPLPGPILTPIVYAAELPQVTDIDALVRASATEYHLNYDHFYKTLQCESAGFADVAIQSFVPDPTGPNGREDSWGTAQIHLPDHPDVTRAQAQDPTFAIPWAARLYSKDPTQFHCFKKLYQ